MITETLIIESENACMNWIEKNVTEWKKGFTHVGASPGDDNCTAVWVDASRVVLPVTMNGGFVIRLFPRGCFPQIPDESQEVT